MKKQGLVMGTVLTLVVMLAGCQVAAQSDIPDGDKPVAVQKKVIEAFGLVKCKEHVNISVNSPLSVEMVHVREGQVIAKGDTLSSINMNDLNAQIEIKVQQLTGEKKLLAVLENDITTRSTLVSEGQDPDILKLKHDLNNAQEYYHKLLNELASKKRLVAAGTLTQSEVDLFQKSVDAAKKAWEDVDFLLKSTEYGHQVALTEMENKKLVQKNGIELIQRELEQLRKKIVSPYIEDGKIVCTLDNAIVDAVYVTNGDMTAPSQKLFCLLDLNTLYIEAKIPEDFIQDVAVGMEVRVIPFADKTRIYTGTVVSIAQKAQQQNGETNVLVDISLKDGDSFLIPGFNVDVEIPY